jgi:hypothetical protein
LPGHALGTTPAQAQPPAQTDAWQALAQMGAQLISALAAANDASESAHPWLQHDPATGMRRLSLPLPSGEAARTLADACARLADALRAKG